VVARCDSNKINIWREIEADGAGFVAPDSLEGTTKNLRAWFRSGRRATSENGQLRSHELSAALYCGEFGELPARCVAAQHVIDGLATPLRSIGTCRRNRLELAGDVFR